MLNSKEKVESSIKRALSFLEDLSKIPEKSWDLSAYKHALLCRLEVQYSIAVIRITVCDPQMDLVLPKIDVTRAIQILKSLLEAPLSEKTLEGLHWVDQLLSQIILAMRRRLNVG